MRKIKFRAWHKLMNKMIVPAITLGSKKCVLELATGYLPCKPSDIILMQYTGLKDKNGKEIYEGDVVKCPFPNYETDEEEILTMQVKWIDDEACFSLVGEGLELLMDLPTKKTIEAIGNIYENPELLEARK